MLIYFALFLALADLLTTVLAVRLLGPDIESNTMYVYLIRRHGLLAFSLTYLAAIGLILLIASKLDGLLVGFVSALLVVVIINVFVLLRHFMAHL